MLGIPLFTGHPRILTVKDGILSFIGGFSRDLRYENADHRFRTIENRRYTESIDLLGKGILDENDLFPAELKKRFQ